MENDCRNMRHMELIKTRMHTPPMPWADECLNLREADNTKDVTSLRKTISPDANYHASVTSCAVLEH